MRGGAMDNVVAVDVTGDDVLSMFVRGDNDGDDGNNAVRDEIPPDARWAESKEGKEGGISSSVSSPPARSPRFLLSPPPGLSPSTPGASALTPPLLPLPASSDTWGITEISKVEAAEGESALGVVSGEWVFGEEGEREGVVLGDDDGDDGDDGGVWVSICLVCGCCCWASFSFREDSEFGAS